MASTTVQRGGCRHTWLPEAKGLYDPAFEKDACGVGAIANLDGKPSRSVMTQADEMGLHMTHRGGCGCEPNSGDGAGVLLGMPHSFNRGVVAPEMKIELPLDGLYATGIVFLPVDPDLRTQAMALLDAKLHLAGCKTLGWRTPPTDNSTLGSVAVGGEPAIGQIFIGAQNAASAQEEVERRVFLARKNTEIAAIQDPDKFAELYVVSLSTRTICYKGQFLPAQVFEYYEDLRHPAFETHVALVHSRFSTNTFPSWARAQPNRFTAHNGEINTLRGNKNWMRSRKADLHSSLLPELTDNPDTIVESNEYSDSGNMDNVLEIMALASDRTLAESVLMMLPKAWQQDATLPDHERAFYEYHSCVMEPWDGPAMVAFTDGRVMGATLDRNGLRPCRYYVTKQGECLISSEVGVLHQVKHEDIVRKGRVEPGRMFLIDFAAGRIIEDQELKLDVGNRLPYQKWVQDNLVPISTLAPMPAVPYTGTLRGEDLLQKLRVFGYSNETLSLLLLPMVSTKKEALGSMGNDAALACLSSLPLPIFDYFKQLFAQVTNPPIDSIRESMVMSVSCPVGPESNLLDRTPNQCRRLLLPKPLLLHHEMEAIKNTPPHGWRTVVLDITVPLGTSFVQGLQALCQAAKAAVSQGAAILVLSDLATDAQRVAMPCLCAVGAVHHALVNSELRSRAAVLLESAEPREVHHFCLLFGYGLDGVLPYLAYDCLLDAFANGQLQVPEGPVAVLDTYRYSVEKGMLKTMGKMGISTLQSYKGAQIFEAVGLAAEIIDLCFCGTASRIGGISMTQLEENYKRNHDSGHGSMDIVLASKGQFNYRSGGEEHLNTPHAIAMLQEAARKDSRHAFEAFSKETDAQNAKVTLRGSFEFKKSRQSVPLGEVEPAQAIIKRFVTGAMSFGSISHEAHETLALAMNSMGAKSNTGEGGEDDKRFLPLEAGQEQVGGYITKPGDTKRSAIKQVASGRFGVTSNYLTNADEIQIKMAQGAKPGEGGELPSHKVQGDIARIRRATPGVGLISPPPHHDIYSIEDLAQLIHDLKNANRAARISVKLVSEVGVGVIAAGVVKAKADHITISGHDGGTGAAAWTGVKNCGLPWELGLAEAQQTLVLNNLRDRTVLQTDGQLKTGRDVVIAALLGAEEFGFSTVPLIAMGCIMMRKCHLNTCPVGIATQDAELRKKFAGKPEHVVNYFFLLAESVREIMSKLGFRTMDEMIGHTEMLQADRALSIANQAGLDLSPMLLPSASLRPDAGSMINTSTQDHGLDDVLDLKLIAAAPLEAPFEPVVYSGPICNSDRTTGAMLSNEVSKRFGEQGLPCNYRCELHGSAGQSFGAFLAKGVSLVLYGDANDYVGKGLSGGELIIRPNQLALENGFVAEKNIVVGNVACYGATSGRVFFRGMVGERFCVRNSGVTAVCEGLGDHGCEYMTGGCVVVLGDTGINFGAGMSGGMAFVWDPVGRFTEDGRVNPGLVQLEPVEESEDQVLLLSIVYAHRELTGSTVASALLDNWDLSISQFHKVMPVDYKAYLIKLKQAKPQRAVMAAPAASDGTDMEDMGFGNAAATRTKPKPRGKSVRRRANKALVASDAAATQSASPPAKLNKLRGFIEYERNADAYRNVTERLEDWGEVNGTAQEVEPEERKKQAARCMDCGTPFCQTYNGCPINNLIPEFNELVFRDQWKAALDRLLSTNNFPEFTGRVCPAPCEGSCVAGIVGDPVTIKNIEYAIIERGFREGWMVPRPPSSRTGKRVSIVGSGPAGLAAADQLNKMGHLVTVLERADEIGGLLMYGIPNMKLSKDKIKRRVDLMAAEGIIFKCNAEVGSANLSLTSIQRSSDAVLLACGATVPRKLPVKGHELEGVHMAMDFLTQNTQALLRDGTYQATECSGDYISAKGLNVVVIGGGDTGTDCIGTSIRHGAKSVINLELLPQPPEERDSTNPWPEWPRVYRVDYGHHEGREKFGEDPRQYCLMTKTFIGDAMGRVCGVEVESVEWKQNMHEDKGLKPKWELVPVPDSKKTITTDLVILALGFLGPEPDLAHSQGITLDKSSNFEATYGEFQTSVPGVFAAGDCRRGQSLVVWAINEGRLAADKIHEHITGAPQVVEIDSLKDD